MGQSQVSTLLKSLDEEINGNASSREFVEDLQIFLENPHERLKQGVKEKLEEADRADEIEWAELNKEHFAKLLERFQHYPSAQKLFAYFLARIHDVFNQHIRPYGYKHSRHDVDLIIENKIVSPILDDMGSGFTHFTLNHTHIRGMIFWLADRCFIRWR